MDRERKFISIFPSTFEKSKDNNMTMIEKFKSRAIIFLNTVLNQRNFEPVLQNFVHVTLVFGH